MKSSKIQYLKIMELKSKLPKCQLLDDELTH